MLRYILLNKMELLIKQQMIYTENERKFHNHERKKKGNIRKRTV